MQRDRHKAGADYLRLVKERTGLNGKTLAERAGLDAPSTINRPLGKKPGHTAVSLNTLVKVNQATGIPFTEEVVRAYNLPPDLAKSTFPKAMAGNPTREAKPMSQRIETVWIEEIQAHPLRDDTVLIQLLDASGVRFQVKLPLEEIRRFREQTRDY